MIPLFALSVTLNEKGKREVQRQIADSITTAMHYYFMTLEQELGRVIRTQQEFINDESLLELSNQYAILTDYDRTSTTNALLARLKAFKDSSAYIANISVYVPSNRVTFSTKEGVDYSESVASDMMKISQAIYDGGIPLTYWNEGLYLNLTYPYFPVKPDASVKPPQFVQNIELSMPALRRALDALPIQGGAVLFGDSWQAARDPLRELLPEVMRQTAADRERETAFARTLRIGGDTYMAMYEKSMVLDTSLIVYFPKDVIVGQLKTYGTWSWLLICASLIVIILMSYSIYLLVHRPFKQLIGRFVNLERGNFEAAFKSLRKDEFGYLYQRFDRTMDRLRTLIDQLYVQKIRLQQSELKQLQMQIAPHFLYNSFYILHRLIRNGDNDTAELMSKNLGEYFQYITRNGLEEVDLISEVRHISSYIEIQNIRFSNRIRVDIDPLPEPYERIKVPRLILQPLIENAYEHGLGDVVTEGRLRISFETEEDRLYFTVEDNGKGFTAEAEAELHRKLFKDKEEGETTGLVNIQRRLKLKFGSAGGIEASNGDSGGARIRIYIPCEGGAKP
ncbi:sensor histidine kinase [Cohnella sp. GCM10012308]|uniref:sensor histidine kinase n=1 Tax=Cohnella sp. GCM10012308 TaxID=3317329 RepID=UPI0036205459